MSTEAPLSMTPLTRSKNRPLAALPIARVDSSKMISPPPGSWSCIARAIATAARSSAESSPTFSLTSTLAPSLANTAATAARSALPSILLVKRPDALKRPSLTFSHTVRSSTRPRFWCTTESPAVRASRGRTGNESALPSTVMAPPGSGV